MDVLNHFTEEELRNHKNRFPNKKDFNLDISDIQGSHPRDMKYKDRGLKKMNFYPQSDNYKNLNNYYNKQSLGQQNAIVQSLIKEQYKYHPYDLSQSRLKDDVPLKKEL